MRNKFFTLFLGLVVMAFAANAQSLFKADGALKQKTPVITQTHQIFTPATKAVIFSEDFEGGAIPTGWTTIDGDCGWTVSTDGSSGYFTIPEHTTYAFVNDDDCNGDMSDVWLITPSMDLSSYTSPSLVFESFQYYDVFTIKVSVDGGTTFEDLAVIPSNGAEWESIALSLAAYAGQANVQIAFHYNDAGSWGYGWAIDDVFVIEPEPHDLGIVSIAPAFVMAGESVMPVVQVGNYGTADEATYTVTLTDGDAYTETISDDGTLEAGYMYDFEFPAWSPAEGTQTLTATVTVADDANTANDTWSIDVIVTAADAYAGNSSQGVYGIVNLTDGVLTPIATLGTDPFPMSEELAGDVIYRVNSDLSFGTVSGGAYTALGTITGATGTPTALAYDWDNDLLYMIVLNGSSLPDTYILNAETLEATLVGSGDFGMVIGADFADDGYIYGPTLDDVLVMIDPATGATTQIGAIGFDANYGQDVSFNLADGMLYSMTCGDTYAFGTYDLTTGAFTQIADNAGDQYATFVITTEPESNALFEDFEGEFLPMGWSQTSYERSWGLTDGFPINGAYTAIIVQSVGNPEEMLITRPLILDGSITTFSYLTVGLNNVYGFGSTTLQVKYREFGTETWNNLGDPDDYAVSGDELREVVLDLSGIANGEYEFAFATTSTFDYTGYNSGAILDDITGPEPVHLNVVTFNVTNGTDPVENVNITIDGQTVITNAEGVAYVGLFDGEYDWVATHNDYYESTGTVTVSGADVTVDVTMSAAPTSVVTFNVTDGSAAIEGISIMVNDQVLTTDASGVATVNLVDGDYDWVAAHGDYLDAMGTVTVAGAAVSVDVTMDLVPEGMVLYQDDFESYNVGDFVAASSDYWETWSGPDGGGDDDAIISDDFANSPTKSMLIADGGNDDMIFPLGDKSEGLYYVAFYFYIESGADYEGYFNFQGTSTPGEVFAFETYFLQDGTGTINVNGDETFTYNHDSWELVELIVDLDNDHASFRINGEYVTSWEYTENLGGIDIYAGADSGTPKFYVDDIVYKDLNFAGGIVTFNVTDGTNAVEGATIDINGSTLTTDASGMASVLLDDGEYEYTVEAAGFAPVTGTVTVASADVSVDVALEVVYNVTFNVDMSENGLFGEESLLWLSGGAQEEADGGIGQYDRWPQPGTYPDFRFTDADGDMIFTLELSGVLPGTYEYKYFITEPGTPSWDVGYPEQNDSFTVVDQDVTIDQAWVTGITDANLIGFKLYPNPTTGVLNVTVDNVYELSVSNTVGQVVLSQIVNETGTIDLSNCASGVYFVTVKSNEVTSTLRIIVE